MSILSANPRTTAIAMGIVATFVSSAAVAEAPRVVATIKPVYSLAAAVMGNIAKPYLLLKGGASPHSYSLRPSDARHLAHANLVLWIGDELEAFMEKPLHTLAGKATVIALHEAKGVHLLKTRKGGIWEAHHHDKAEHGHEKDHADNDEHEHGEYDMHVWLDPHNAKAMVRAIAAALAKADPTHAGTYRRNATATIGRLDKLEAELDRTLSPLRSRPFIVFHDAYQYFEKRFHLTTAGSVTVNPQQAPGARRLSQLRRRIINAKVRCVFIEPQFPPRVVDTIIAGTPARKAVLDPLGAAIPAGPDAYFTLMRNLAGALRGCLAA
jgi:zinc transport system substrate-binding protein